MAKATAPKVTPRLSVKGTVQGAALIYVTITGDLFPKNKLVTLECEYVLIPSQLPGIRNSIPLPSATSDNFYGSISCRKSCNIKIKANIVLGVWASINGKIVGPPATLVLSAKDENP